jgi:hypothetical protein
LFLFQLIFRTYWILLAHYSRTLIELICSRIGGKSLKPQASNSIILVLLDAVPIIYACVYLFYTSPRNILHMLTRSRSNCMLYILNTRRSLRSAGSSAGLGNSNTNQPPSGSRTRGQWRSGAGPVELSSLGGVQVRTQIETADTDGHYPVRLFFFTCFLPSPFLAPPKLRPSTPQMCARSI